MSALEDENSALRSRVTALAGALQSARILVAETATRESADGLVYAATVLQHIDEALEMVQP